MNSLLSVETIRAFRSQSRTSKFEFISCMVLSYPGESYEGGAGSDWWGEKTASEGSKPLGV